MILTTKVIPRHARVLVIRLDEIGDLVLTTPFLRELHTFQPDAWISLIVKPGVANLFKNCPYINDLLPLSPRQERWPRQALNWLRLWRFARKSVTPRAFDLALLPRWGIDSSPARHVAAFAGIPRRVAFRQSLGACWSARFANETVDSPSLEHSVTKHLAMLRHLGHAPTSDALELWMSRDDRETARQRLIPILAVHDNTPLIAIAPGALQASKRWPWERYVAVMQAVHAATKARFVLIGDSFDHEWLAQASTIPSLSVLNLAGQTTLRQTAALLEHCTLYLGNDTGPLHLAAAVHRPVVGVYSVAATSTGPCAAARFAPWQVPHRILQPLSALAPCAEACSAHEPHCILAVQPDDVARAVLRLLQERPS